MNLKSFFLKDPDAHEGVFEPITFEAPGSSNSKLVLGFVKEHGSLYFIINKRHTAWGNDIYLDRMRLSDAVRKIRNTEFPPCPSECNNSLISSAFEVFVTGSPFMLYIKEVLAKHDITPFINKLVSLTPTLITSASRK